MKKHSFFISIYSFYTFTHRHDSKEEKADEINTASNEAYEVLKQRGMPEESKEKTTEGAVYEVIPGEN